MSFYAMNLFDISNADDYRQYSRGSAEPAAKLGARVVALGSLNASAPHLGDGGDGPRQVMGLVEWPTLAAFQSYIADPELADLHRLRESGTNRYIWWGYDRLEDLRPVLRRDS
jgi:uncharacterized protein (DUF1330 family)